MAVAQPGIFAVGTAAHCYLEFDRAEGLDPRALVRAVAGLEEPHAAVGGINIVVGVRPTLWAECAPRADVPAGVHDFAEPVRGPDGFTMPATQHDAWVWVSGAGRDLVYDVSLSIIDALRPVARLASELTGWIYHNRRDLTGFIDGTENPSIAEAPAVAVIGPGQDGEGASILLYQRWAHDAEAWRALPHADQERVIGRSKADSIELDEDVMPASSHVSRTVIERDGEERKIYRRNTPYGGVTEQGTVFVGFCAVQATLHEMLERMAGVGDSIRDELTRYAAAVSGSYYIVPSNDALRALTTDSVR